MKYLSKYEKFNESPQVDIYDVRDILLEIDDLEVTCEKTSNIYLNINLECESGIDPNKHKEVFDRLKEYLSICGYKLRYIEDTNRVYYLTLCWEWSYLFNIPKFYKDKLKKIKISFENLN